MKTFLSRLILTFSIAATLLSERAESLTIPSKPTIADYHLSTLAKIKAFSAKEEGKAWVVDKGNFPALENVTCFTLEIWEESMRVPHWHPTAYELGYVVSGSVEIILWRSTGETSLFTLSAGMCWFIPQGALHSLNNIGNSKAELLVAFSSDHPQDVDLPVAYNGIPAPLRNAYTSPHSELKNWSGVIENPLVAKYTPDIAIKNMSIGSPYKFDLARVTPLFSDPMIGSVVWGVKDNWSILQNISVLRAQLKPGVARDPIWYPDAGTLYVVSQGKGEFHIIIPDQNPQPFEINRFDYIYVPVGTLHTFVNNSAEDLELIAFFTQDNPLPEVSLSVATGFFPDSIRRQAMTEYGDERKSGDPLKDLIHTGINPYLLKIKND